MHGEKVYIDQHLLGLLLKHGFMWAVRRELPKHENLLIKTCFSSIKGETSIE